MNNWPTTLKPTALASKGAGALFLRLSEYGNPAEWAGLSLTS